MMIPSNAARAVIETYIAAISARDWDALPGFFTADATWWVSGNPARVPKAGIKPAAEHLPNLPNLINKFDDYSLNIVNMVAQGPNVFIEAQAVGTGPLDLVYINNITQSFVLNQDQKITALRESPVHSEIDWVLKWFADHPDA